MGARVAAFAIGLLFTAAQGSRGDDAWATALFAERGVDFGAVPRGAVLSHRFTLTNRTNELVNVLDVRASCGCTTGRAAANTIAPGESTVIEAQMDTRNFVGVKVTNLIITLVTAGGRQAEVRLVVRSNILSDIVLNPGTLSFGAVARGQTAQQVLTIDRHGASDWRIERMLASKRLSEFVEASLVEAYRSERGVGYELTVRLKPGAPVGVLREQIRLATNDRETPVVPVLVSADVRGALSATPSLVSLGAASSAAGAVTGRVLIKGSAPFAISAIEGGGDGFELVESEPGTKPVHILTVTFHPDQTQARGALRRMFRVVSDMPNEAPLDVQAVVNVSP